jgi:hypothetical protein
MLSFRLAFALSVAFICCAPAQAINLGSTPPTIIVRQQPVSPLSVIYVVFSGTLSDMVVAEQAVANFFKPTGVTVIGASSDVSDVAQLQSTDIATRVSTRLAAIGKPTSLFSIKISRVAGSEVTFSMTLSAVGTGEIAIGEVMVNTDSQFTISDSNALSRRISIRDATSRFLKDKRIREMFVR